MQIKYKLEASNIFKFVLSVSSGVEMRNLQKCEGIMYILYIYFTFFQSMFLLYVTRPQLSLKQICAVLICCL